MDLIGKSGDGIERAVRGFRAVRYDVPPGSCAGYYPECNPLLPLWHHAERSHVPAAKSIPIKIRKIRRLTADANPARAPATLCSFSIWDFVDHLRFSQR